jgi:hypothetical protein
MVVSGRHGLAADDELRPERDRGERRRRAEEPPAREFRHA